MGNETHEVQYRRFLARNSEHLMAGVHLWCWIYYDFASIFPHKYPKISSSAILNSTTHGMLCLLLLWMLRSIKDVHASQEYKLTRYNSFSTFACTFAIHFSLSMIVVHRLNNELIVPKLYQYISPNWWKYVIRAYLTTFFSTESLLLFRQSYGSSVSAKIEKMTSILCYFILIFIIRIGFHLQVAYD